MALIQKMALALNLPIEYLLRTARKASHCYKVYSIPKRSGGQRTIHHPAGELKALQRWLLYGVLESLPVHESAVAYRRGLSIKDNASRHVNSRYLLRLDFVDFFHSLTAEDIRNYVTAHQSLFPGWDTADIEFFISIVCLRGRLTIGAPTSPSLSNILCYGLDSELIRLSESDHVIYTRYADDLFFSSDQPNILSNFPKIVEAVLASLQIPKGLRVNHQKTRHSSKKGQRRVTGIILGSDGRISIGRSIKRFIRRQIHQYHALSPEERTELAGYIAYAQSIDPDIINSLILKYGLDLVTKARSIR